MSEFIASTTDEPFSGVLGPGIRKLTDDEKLEHWPNPQNLPGELVIAAHSISSVIAGHPQDWAAYYRDAWLYGIIAGWECQAPGCEHVAGDEDCEDAMQAVAARHGWSDEDVARLKRYRAAWVAAFEGDDA